MKLTYAMAAFAVLACAGCAEDHYTIIPNTAGSPERLSDDLSYCKQWAIHEHFAREDQAKSGALAVGLGGIGGAINELTQPDENDPNHLIESCMRAKGYSGTSSG